MGFSETVTLGATGLRTRRMGIGADQGVSASTLRWAFEHGLNYFYWGSRRTPGMQQAIRELSPAHRDDMIVAIQVYDTTGLTMGMSVRRALRRLKLDYADVLILGKRDRPVARRIEDHAQRLREAGHVRHLCVSAHDRSAYQTHLSRGIYDLIMVRYNCAHPGAEREVFPLLEEASPRPGVIVYNSTRWGHLFDDAWIPDGEPTPAPTHLYRHALSHPDVDMVLTAPKSQQHLEDNIRALEQGPLSEDECAWLARVGKHVHGRSPNTSWDFLFQDSSP